MSCRTERGRLTRVVSVSATSSSLACWSAGSSRLPGLLDESRTSYLHDHIEAVLRARGEGIDVRGSFAWSLLDNLEWSSGWTKKFGIIRVDPDTGLRTPKDSARWYRRQLSARKGWGYSHSDR